MGHFFAFIKIWSEFGNFARIKKCSVKDWEIEDFTDRINTD